MTVFESALKRSFDAGLAGAALLLATPILLAIGVAVKLESDGPVFYRGARVGRFGKDFRIFKFRTMVANAEARGGSSTADDDPRITRIGHRLRRYKLDELPQLINVLLGDMSFVGPRPQVRSDVSRYTPEERLLLSVRPGITDLASIRFHNEGEILRGHPDPDAAYDRLIRPEKMRLALNYVREASLALDLEILWSTVRTLTGTQMRFQ